MTNGRRQGLILHLRAYDWGRAFRVGADLARDQVRRGDPVDDRAVMWALLCDAASVSALAYRGPPFPGWPNRSSLPDAPSEVTIWHQVAAYLRGELDEMPVDGSQPPLPSAEAVTRAEHVLQVWHVAALAHMGDWSRIRRAVYLKALGVPDRKVMSITGLSRERIKHAKRRAVGDMLDFVRGIDQFTNSGHLSRQDRRGAFKSTPDLPHKNRA